MACLLTYVPQHSPSCSVHDWSRIQSKRVMPKKSLYELELARQEYTFDGPNITNHIKIQCKCAVPCNPTITQECIAHSDWPSKYFQTFSISPENRLLHQIRLCGGCNVDTSVRNLKITEFMPDCPQIWSAYYRHYARKNKKKFVSFRLPINSFPFKSYRQDNIWGNSWKTSTKIISGN